MQCLLHVSVTRDHFSLPCSRASGQCWVNLTRGQCALDVSTLPCSSVAGRLLYSESALVLHANPCTLTVANHHSWISSRPCKCALASPPSPQISFCTRQRQDRLPGRAPPTPCSTSHRGRSALLFSLLVLLSFPGRFFLLRKTLHADPLPALPARPQRSCAVGPSPVPWEPTLTLAVHWGSLLVFSHSSPCSFLVSPSHGSSLS